MKKIILLLILILFISTNFISYNIIYAAEVSTAEWREDLNYLKSELPLKHLNLFSELNQAEFNREIEELKFDLAELSQLEITLRIIEIFNKVGDQNLALDNTSYLREYYPFYLKKFADGYRVMAVNKNYKEILGAKLISINGHSLEELKFKFSGLINADNYYALESRLQSFLNLKDVLIYLNIIDQNNIFSFQEGENYFNVNFEAEKIENIKANSEKLIELDYQKNNFSKKEKQLFYVDYFPTEKTIYLQYNSLQKGHHDKIAVEDLEQNDLNNSSFKKMEAQLFNFLNYREVNKFIIDLRYNSGGDYRPGLELAEKLSAYKDTLRFYVIIGKDTYSTAILNALNFKYKLNAYLVGYPTLTKINHFGEVKSFRLPNSKLKISYSAKYYQILEKSDPDSLYPDIMVEQEFEDFLNGKDTVLKLINTID